MMLQIVLNLCIIYAELNKMSGFARYHSVPRAGLGNRWLHLLPDLVRVPRAGDFDSVFN